MQKKRKSFKLFKKYNYNIDEVIGVKNKDEKYILYFDKKLIRIYRGNLKTNALICSTIPIEQVIVYNFYVEKNVIDKIDLDAMVETKVYEEAGLKETEEHIIKYKIIDKYKDNDYVSIQCVIIPMSLINENYKFILDEVGYIDYLSFPGFAYKALYAEGLLKKGNDIFVVILYDKIFLTFYSNGELVYLTILTGGLNKIYEALEKLKIIDYDIKLFKKLLTKKGVDLDRYASRELIVLETIKKEFSTITTLIEEQISKIISDFEVSGFDRLFVTSEYGEIPGLEKYLEEHINIEVKNFEFYQKYNLDRLPIDPFLFLAMLETHYAYKFDDQRFNFSPYLREPTFFYRPSGKLFLATLGFTLLFGALPLYEYLVGLTYEYKADKLKIQNDKLSQEVNALQKTMIALEKKEKVIKKVIENFENEIKELKNYIKNVYEFKFEYLPKSQQMVDITKYLNKYKVYVKNMSYKEGMYVLNIYSYKDKNIADMIKNMTDDGFDVYSKEIKLENDKYLSQIRIKE